MGGGITQQSPNVGALATENTLLSIAGFVTDPYDYVAVTYPAADTEVFTYKTGGSGGTTVAVVTIVYTSSAKLDISTITKT